MLPLMMSTMLMPGFSSPYPSAAYLKEQLDKDIEHKEGDGN